MLSFLVVTCFCDFCSGFIMDHNLNRHTYGFIQSRLVPFYLHLGSACAFFNLSIYAVYHPRDIMDDRESFQVCWLIGYTVFCKKKKRKIVLLLEPF